MALHAPPQSCAARHPSMIGQSRARCIERLVAWSGKLNVPAATRISRCVGVLMLTAVNTSCATREPHTSGWRVDTASSKHRKSSPHRPTTNSLIRRWTRRHPSNRSKRKAASRGGVLAALTCSRHRKRQEGTAAGCSTAGAGTGTYWQCIPRGII